MKTLKEAFRDNFATRREMGASVSVWCDGVETEFLAAGYRDRLGEEAWLEDTLVLVWSATKGPAAACVLHALQTRELTLDTRVSHVWPEFAQAGKSEVTFGEALSHQAGLPVLDRKVSVFDHYAVAAAIAAQTPHWPRGTAHGYGPRVHGFLLDEMVRRLDGRTLGTYWREVFAEPLGLEFWIGLPDPLHGRVADMLPAPTSSRMNDPFYTAFNDPTTFSHRAFTSPAGLSSVSSMNTPEARSASLPGFGGIGTARALAKFYALLACGGTLDGHTLFTPETIGWMTTTLAQGNDRVLLQETAYSAGFMRDPVDANGNKTRELFGPGKLAFGHSGQVAATPSPTRNAACRSPT